jgi:UDP-N-acetylmuramoylalanine--D-glutamate ligase
VVVVGAARSGVAAAELLARRGARVTLTDLRDAIAEAGRLEAAGVTLELGGHRAATLAAADLVVLSPGVPLRQPAVDPARAAGVPVIGEIELASRWLRGRIVAITGTKGKSTTTTLTGRILHEGGLAATVGGNIGVPLSAQVEASTPETIHVVEVSSFQLEATDTFRPWIAVLLNFSPDHLDRHASVAEYAAAKARIFANQRRDDWAVVNADDPAAAGLADGARAQRLRFAVDSTLAEGVVVRDGRIVRRTPQGEVPLVPLTAVRLPGSHLLSDVVAAAAVASVIGVSPEAMTRAVSGFAGLEHVLEPAGTIGGVRFVNDSKATNVAAARRAIESFGPALVVILGGRYKGGDFAELREPLAARQALVLAIGDARPLIAAALGDAVRVQEVATFEEAVRVGHAAVPGGGTVLLAPACASFDMFVDYAERGRVFKEEVARLARQLDGSG